jgi:hypothetical protein
LTGDSSRLAAGAVFLVAALLAARLAIRERPTAHADSAEYLLTAESLFNHGTPNVHPADLLSFGRIASRFPLEGDYQVTNVLFALGALAHVLFFSGLSTVARRLLAVLLAVSPLPLTDPVVHRSARGCRKAWLQKRHFPEVTASCGEPPVSGPDFRVLKASSGPDAWAYVSW